MMLLNEPMSIVSVRLHTNENIRHSRRANSSGMKTVHEAAFSFAESYSVGYE